MYLVKISLLLLTAATLTGGPFAYGQESSATISLAEFRKAPQRKLIQIPDINGYKVLKADFHMHTVFSDGFVWPSIRIQEAWQEGLDVMAITEHIEFTPNSGILNTDPDRLYESIANTVQSKNLILIKGAEITRKTPPGHFNALFVGELAGYERDQSNAMDAIAIKRAHDQKSFIFWDHPGWQDAAIPGSYEWTHFVDSLAKARVLGGIEVANAQSNGLYKKAIDWALDHDLAIMANSDLHNVSGYDFNFDLPYVHRPMTLVLAKEKSENSVREALEAGRTIAWASKYLIGKEEYLRQLFNACVSVSPSLHSTSYTNKSTGITTVTDYYEIANNSDLYFELKLKSGDGSGSVILHPRSAQTIAARNGIQLLEYEVISTFVRSDQHLKVDIHLKKGNK
ncbi:Sb-PDE family phosphodiesterase [Parapedobacter deserti]|uniref:Sb-PDE family phosphodiesterase n=1 Tax=Parapedobacter deserti TaxID=1912957 RepID=A0ABV7JR26_9SPHI